MNPVQRGAYNFTSDYFVAIDRVDLVLPPPGNATKPLYIVYKTDVDRVFYPDGRPLVSITTRSTFYALYGQRIERVIGMSEIKLDPVWKQCSPRMDVSGEGSRLGEIQNTVKLARSSERILWSRLIVTSADIQQFTIPARKARASGCPLTVLGAAVEGRNYEISNAYRHCSGAGSDRFDTVRECGKQDDGPSVLPDSCGNPCPGRKTCHGTAIRRSLNRSRP